MSKNPLPQQLQMVLLLTTSALVAALAIVAARVGPLVVTPQDSVPNTPEIELDLPVAPPPQFFDADGATGWDLPWLPWVAFGFAVVIALLLLWWLLSKLRLPARRAAAPAGAESRLLQTAQLARLTEQADADIGAARTFDLARAADDIVQSWKTVEAAAAAADYPRAAASTPTEFLAQCRTYFGSASARTIVTSQQLLELYHRARFDTTQLAPGAATQARTLAHELLTAWNLTQATAAAPPSARDEIS